MQIVYPHTMTIDQVIKYIIQTNMIDNSAVALLRAKFVASGDPNQQIEIIEDEAGQGLNEVEITEDYLIQRSTRDSAYLADAFMWMSHESN